MKEYFYCGVCGNPYETVEERAQCETKCIEELKKLEEEKKRNEYEEKRKESAESIYEALDNINEMLADHFEKYHSLSLKKGYPYLQSIFSRSPFFF